ncbi:MAG: hypothetical protein AAFV29_23625, partial [Myxococcota bacterium]
MSPQGFFVRYDSRRALDADHAAYMTHGGMMVQIDAETAPPSQTPIRLRIEGPDGIELLISGKVDQHIPGRGLMLWFDEGPSSGRQALDDLIESADFRAKLKAEPP